MRSLVYGRVDGINVADNAALRQQLLAVILRYIRQNSHNKRIGRLDLSNNKRIGRAAAYTYILIYMIYLSSNYVIQFSIIEQS